MIGLRFQNEVNFFLNYLIETKIGRLEKLNSFKPNFIDDSRQRVLFSFHFVKAVFKIIELCHKKYVAKIKCLP